MLRGKFSKIMSVALSASLLIGSLPLFGGGKASADVAHEKVNGNLIQLNEFGGFALTPHGGFGSWGSITPGYDKTITSAEGEGKITNPIVMMSSDRSTTYVQDSVGDIYYWGARKTEVGNSYSTVAYPAKVTDISNVDQIQTADRSNLAVKDGDLYLWGALNYSRFSSEYNTGTPKKVPLPGKVKKALFATGKTLILLDNGDLGQISESKMTYTSLGQESMEDFWVGFEYAIAKNTQGELIHWRPYDTFPSYRKITNAPDDIKQISVGRNHFLLLRENGKVMSFGINNSLYRQLGTTVDTSGTMTSNKLVDADRLPANVVYVSAGYENSAIVTADGKVYVWGYNAFGNLGLTHKNSLGVPTVVPELSNYVLVAPTKPSTPTNFKVTTEESSLTATWDSVAGATSYKVTVGEEEVYNGSNLSFTYKALTANTDYIVDVVAVNSAGESTKSSLTVKTKVHAVNANLDERGKYGNNLTDAPHMDYLNWGFADQTTLVLQSKAEYNYAVRFYLDGKSVYYADGTPSVKTLTNLPKNADTTLEVEWTQRSTGDTGKWNLLLSSPMTKSLVLGNQSATFGDVVDLKTAGLWKVAGNNFLINHSGYYGSVGEGTSTAKWALDLTSNTTGSFGKTLRTANETIAAGSVDYPFVPRTWSVYSWIEDEKVYDYSSAIGLAGNRDYKEYFGMMLYDANGYGGVTFSKGFVSPNTVEDATKVGGQGRVFTGQSSGSAAKPNYQLNVVASNEKYSVPRMGEINSETQFTGIGTTTSPFVIAERLSAPINLTTNVVNKTSLVVSWNPVAGADKYTIMINGKIAHTSSEDTSKVFYDMLPDTKYVVEVFASKGGVDGLRSTSTSITPEAEAKLEAPTTPTVVSTEVGNVKISWNVTSGALLYKVFRNGVEVGSVSSPSYTDKNAVEGEAYLYSVKSFDGAKNSDASPFVLVNVTAKVEVPKAPSNPSKFRVVSDEHSVTASWEAAVGADTYQVVINGLEVYNGPELNYTYTGLPEKTEYRVEISAVNSVGKSGSQLMTIWTKDPLKLPAAKNPRGETTSNEAIISWDAVEGATSYWVRINNDFVYEGADTTFTAKGLGSDRPYTVYIFAKNDKVDGEPATLSIVTKKEPVVLDKPTNLVANPKATYIKLTWDVVSGATEYIVKQGQAIVYQGKLTTFKQTDLPSGATYNYEVIAVKGDAQSEPATVSATTLVAQLAYPANFRVTDLAWNNIRLDWDEVEGADEYLITRDGMSIGVPQNTGWSEGSDSIWPGATYTYKVAAYKDGVLGKTAQKVVTIPAEPVVGQAPTGDLVIKANRVEHNRVGLSWSTVTGATYYDVYQDDTNKVWTGSLNTITDPNVGPQEQHTYKVVASNEWGTLDSNVIEVTTPAAPQSIVITPAAPMEGTITFNYKVVEGAVMYTERNPQTKAIPLGDGTYKVTYYNAATGEARDLGIQIPINGMLNFVETDVDPSKNYHYDITAVRVKADGSEEVIAREEVSMTTPADGSGVTVPGTTLPPTDPGTGGGNTPTPNPGTGNGGGTTPTNPTTPGTGGSVTNPSTGGSAPSDTNGGSEGNGTVAVPGTVGGTDTEVITEEETEPTTSPSFSDVEGSFANEAILSLSSKGIVKGYSDGTFGGKKKVTRAEFAIFLNRALGYTSSSPYAGTFKDFDEQAWYASELSSALENGITKGFNDNTYRPNAFIPREQAAIMLANVLMKNGSALSDAASYVDQENIVGWAKESVNLVTQESVMSGYPGNKFMPKRELTREEAAQLIYNLIKS
ncbi:S-layer homology domain-containing protein [Paenibacillus sp. LS1]|uniref:S-layer homology domain-containing protein n=1 Tax=Paenibacillus sp. LS1 TaxID=2992120 RepID=UPI00222E957E|nr:S-layer homology domain-containing protein [Paenibacillus sp. LS1]MCW3793762.1 S-layer homology domain-containing protein [Paenibacillus sp. LS1]